MFNIGSGEMLLLFVVALMIFGPNRLPEIGKSVGEAMASFRHAMKTLSDPIMAEVQTQGRAIRDAAQPVPTTTTATAALPAAPAPEAAPAAEAAPVDPPETVTVTTSEVAAPVENASTAEALLAAAQAAESATEPIEVGESPQEEEHVPVPMSAAEPSA